MLRSQSFGGGRRFAEVQEAAQGMAESRQLRVVVRAQREARLSPLQPQVVVPLTKLYP